MAPLCWKPKPSLSDVGARDKRTSEPRIWPFAFSVLCVPTRPSAFMLLIRSRLRQL